MASLVSFQKKHIFSGRGIFCPKPSTNLPMSAIKAYIGKFKYWQGRLVRYQIKLSATIGKHEFVVLLIILNDFFETFPISTKLTRRLWMRARKFVCLGKYIGIRVSSDRFSNCKFFLLFFSNWTSCCIIFALESSLQEYDLSFSQILLLLAWLEAKFWA